MAGIENDNKRIDECAICMEKYDQNDRQPKLLLCHHSFCLKCLDTICKETEMVECPNCKERTWVPEGGAKNLQYNFYIDQLFKVEQFRQNESNDDTCTKHSKPFEFFCETCTAMVCSRCALSAHKFHKIKHYDDLKKNLKRYVEEVRTKSNKAKSVVDAKRKKIVELESTIEAIRAKKSTNLLQVNQMFLSISEILKKKEEDMKESIGAQYDEMSSDVYSEIENENFKIACLQSLSTLLDESIERQKPIVVTQMAKNPDIDTRLETLCKSAATKCDDLNMKEIYENSQMMLQAMKDGTSNLPATDAFPFQIREKNTSLAVAGIVATAKFTLNIKFSGLDVTILDPEADVIACVVNSTDGATYRIMYRPQVSGEHTCVIKYFGLPIPDAEFRMRVKSNNPLTKIGSPGQAPGQLDCPAGIVFDAEFNVYVSDRENQRIQKFRKDGQYVIHWKVGGRDGKKYPGILTMNKVANEVVCYMLNNNESGEGQSFHGTNILHIFDTMGNMKNEITVQEMKYIARVAINSQQQIICVDPILHKIFILNRQWEMFKKVGGYGTGPCLFRNPTDVCVGPDDDIIVADLSNKRVQVLNKNGLFKHQFGHEGCGKGQFNKPVSVSVDKEGHILISDTDRNDIQVFMYAGQFLSCIESAGDKMNCPVALTVTDDHHVLVADSNHHCVKIYKYI